MPISELEYTTLAIALTSSPRWDSLILAVVPLEIASPYPRYIQTSSAILFVP